MLSVPPNRAHSSLLTHPGSSRVGKEGEQLIYFGDIQEQGSPEFSVSWRIFFFIRHLLCGKYYSWNLNSHDLISVYEIGSTTLIVQMRKLMFHLNLRGGEKRNQKV